MKTTAEIVDALVKQTPVPPIVDKYKRVQCRNGHNLPAVCKNNHLPYCPFCGQKIKWEEEHEA